MRKFIYKIALVASVALVYSSCDSLDLSPEDYYGSGNFWKNQAQAEGFMEGVHSQLRGNSWMFYYLGELRSGTQRTGTSSLATTLNYEELRTNNIDRDKPGIGNFAGLYSNSILNLNHAIEQLGKADYIAEAKKKELLGQAHGIRSLYYFMLFKTFGGVPLVTEAKVLKEKISPENFYIPQSTPEQTMEFIKSDILKSEEFFADMTLGGSYNKHKWSKAATLALKAEIFMWSAKVNVTNFTAKGEQDLRVAKTALEQLKGKFSLMEKFADVFATNHRANKEVILAIRYPDGEAENGGGSFFSAENLFLNTAYDKDGNLITEDPFNLRGRGGVFRDEYKYDFWKSYEDGDTRRDATFYHFYNKEQLVPENFGCFMLKRIGSINSSNNRIWDSDMIIYRYSDVLLMLAEVENGLNGDPSEYVNEVRRRAYGDQFAGKEFVSKTYAENELEILKERDKEFVAEGKRWFDLIRMHDANKQPLAFVKEAAYPETSSVIPTTEKHKLLWPVDKNTRALNTSLKQTPGYEE